MEVIPRPAATILLLRDGPEGIEVFMVVRHHGMDFASGALVFPGGRVEDSDHAFAARTDDCPPLPGVALEQMGFRIAAIRETFEECGVLLARPRGSDQLVDAATLKEVEDRHRAALNAESITFEDMVRSENLTAATDLLVHFAHWITPADQRKRYDTHFYLAEAPAEHLAVHDGWEAVESIWITPQRALDETDAGKYKLVFATAANLRKLVRSRTVAEAMASARAADVVTVLPRSTRLEDGKRMMHIPEEAGYGGSEFIITYVPAS